MPGAADLPNMKRFLHWSPIALGVVFLLLLASLQKDRALQGKSGFYVDTLVKTAQGWRFRTREFWRDNDADSPFRRGAAPPPMPWL